MKRNLLEQAAGFIKRQRNRQRWYKVFSVMAAVVVFVTTYALILPAITMERPAICGMEAHVHTADCYARTADGYACMADLQLHTHTDACYDEQENLVCGYADFVLHTHNEFCYDAGGNLVCPLDEVTSYTVEQPVLTEETTGDAATGSALAFIMEKLHGDTVEYTEPHTHSEDCYDEAGSLVCGQLEVQAHQHDATCFTDDARICGLEEHQHTEGCYGEQKQPDADTEYICGLEEHTHGGACYDENGELICGLEEHQHSEGCYGEQKQPDADTEYICGLEEHTHGEACYDENGELICTLPEHQHSEGCVSQAVTPKDDAFVSELLVTDANVLSDLSEPGEPMTVRNGEAISYRLQMHVQSYSDSSLLGKRVKLEFVLPVAEEQAKFDLASMPWLDNSEGYAPVVTTEQRLIDTQEITCQVLTGYKLLSQQETDSGVSDVFEEDVVVSVINVPPGESIAIQICAAMEQNTWEGTCPTHGIEEKLTIATDAFAVVVYLTEAEKQAIYQAFLTEIEELETQEITEETAAAVVELQERLTVAYKRGELSQENYKILYNRAGALLQSNEEIVAEAAEGSNWMLLRDSGWFEEYDDYAQSSGESATTYTVARRARAVQLDEAPPSDIQVNDRGGTNISEDGSVSVSKTISGTELENVFDITLQVQTSQEIQTIYEEPDMAVVIVMDISNTMNSNFGSVTRYAAAMTAAENFLDQFAANNTLGISKVGYVAFNTDAHQIFGLQSCSTQDQANTLKNTMRTQTGDIINAAGYNDAHSRFTNVEAGLAMASDMLNGVSNKNKYIIFLSDGFPTTYISSGYSGYDPYDSTGRFYDHVLNKKCLYGTSYSDEAAIRARTKAAAIKESGITIFSIGVDVAGQTIQKYITQSENSNGFSVVDRTGTTYEIGDATSTEAYKKWLREKIGSGYYYDSTDSEGLENAYNQIFAEIKHTIEAGSAADWVASDPIPTVSGSAENVEFIGFYNKTPALVSGALTGSNTEGGENTASFDESKSAISWDLKQSGYTMQSVDNKTTYTYTLVYRVRLKNENSSFEEGKIYPTNDTTTLQYRTIEGTDGNIAVSEPKTVEFLIPSVHGYLAELTFTKVDSEGNPLAGAEFTLKHNTDTCSVCRGDGTPVTIADMCATSDEKGTVTFTKIPSGHEYSLEETKVPDGYSANGNTYQVTVAYNNLTVTVTARDGTKPEWDNTILNYVYHELPQTGGPGTTGYILAGLLLMAAAVMLLYKQKQRGREEL